MKNIYIIGMKTETKSKYNLTYHQMKKLEEWTSMECYETLFDSDVDNWSKDTTVFNERIIGKKHLTFLIEDEDNEIFGYFLNTEVIEEYDGMQETDNKTFKFNLQSNGRLQQPMMKFEIKNMKDGGIRLCGKHFNELFLMGNIVLGKKEKKTETYFWKDDYEDYFDYHGIENAVCGKTTDVYGVGDRIKLKRILVIQMK